MHGHPDSTTATPSRLAAIGFWARASVLVAARTVRDALDRELARWPAGPSLHTAPVIAEHRSPLWRDGRDDEFVLTAGKVHNLRLACRVFDGVVVPAGRTLSFWRQVGRPASWRGYVRGREVRSGCVVPTTAGGLCQLSIALASCAAQARIRSVQRQAHTARIESAGPVGHAPGNAAVDATVFWNYVDLRLVADFGYRIETELTADQLIVRLRADLPVRYTRPVTLVRRQSRLRQSPPLPGAEEPRPAHLPIARGCLTCDRHDCFRHRPWPCVDAGRTAMLVDASHPELEAHALTLTGPVDRFEAWTRGASRGDAAAKSVGRTPIAAAIVAASIARALWLRWCARDQGGRQAALTTGRRWLARAYAGALRPEHTDLVIDQALLVPLAQTGALGGRRVDVFATALPAAELQRRLDEAARLRPGDASLSDFRVDHAFCGTEWQALANAHRIITAHAEVARYLRECGLQRVTRVAWQLPAVTRSVRRRCVTEVPVVAFPASALARKGVHELAVVMRDLKWRLLVLGAAAQPPTVWAGVQVEFGRFDGDWCARADVVVLPAYVEHDPRGLLTALAHRLPVVATRACGLPDGRYIEVPPGDPVALRAAIVHAVGRSSQAQVDATLRMSSAKGAVEQRPRAPASTACEKRAGLGT